MDTMYDHSSDGESENPKKGSNSAAYEMIPLDDDFEPTSLDVICARGKEAYNHPGNMRFRELVASNLNTYRNSTSKMAKSQIVRDIIESVRLASPRGGFVKKVDGKWWDVGERARREKTGQQIRDLLHESYKSSTKSKALTRRQMRKSLSTNTTDVKDNIRDAASKYQTAARLPSGKAPPRRPGCLPPKMVSLDSQSSDAAAISAMAFQNQYGFGRGMNNCLPQHRRASEPAVASNYNNIGQIPLDYSERMSGGIEMPSEIMGGRNSSSGMGMIDAGLTSSRGMNNVMDTADMGLGLSMFSNGNSLAMNVSMNCSMNASFNAANSSRNDMNSSRNDMNSSRNVMSFNPNINMNSTNMNVIGNVSQSSSSMHSSGIGWEMSPQETLLQQQQQLLQLQQEQQMLQLQQEQQRLQEQQRQLSEMIQCRSADGSRQRRSSGFLPQLQPFSYGSAQAASQFDVGTSSTNDMMGSLRYQDGPSYNNMGTNFSGMSSGQAPAFNQRKSTLHSSMSDLYQSERMERPVIYEGYDPLPLPLETHLFVEHDPLVQDESEVTFDDAIDNICYVDEPRKQPYDSRHRR